MIGLENLFHGFVEILKVQGSLGSGLLKLQRNALFGPIDH